MSLHPLSLQDLALPDAPLNNQLPPTPLAQLPLLVLVGVTGVGKSTALKALDDEGQGQFALLPDRREITDAVMIWPYAGGPVTDRQERFALTARYREAHAGGMAQALGELGLKGPPTAPLVFDGLRGLDEVRYAAEYFPSWRFVGLHAPDLLRVKRLLGRADHFDQVGISQQQGEMPLSLQLGQLKGVDEVFSPAEIAELSHLAEEGYRASDIVTKTQIVLSERQNYDPTAARRYLQTLEQTRFLDIDSAAMNPEQVAAALRQWL